MPYPQDIQNKEIDNQSKITAILERQYDADTIDIVFNWLNKANFDFLKIPSSKNTSIHRIADIASLPLIQLIYEKRDDGLKHPYGYVDQRDNMAQEDYNILIALAGNDIPLNEKIGPVFDHLAQFRYFDPSQSQATFSDKESEEEGTTPFDQYGTLEYKLLQSVNTYCRKTIPSLQSADEYLHFKNTLTKLKTEGGSCIWEDIKDELAYQIEAPDNHSLKKYQDLMDEARVVINIPIPILLDYQEAIEASKGYRAYCVQEMSKKEFWGSGHRQIQSESVKREEENSNTLTP